MATQTSIGELVLVLTNEVNSTIADGLAKELLNQRLVACVSLREIKSHFRWEDKVEEVNEVELLIKTTENNLANVINAIQALHSYKTPEILYWDVSSIDGYRKWVKDVVSSSL